ncbi:MAG TPA: hypothetical protein ENJ20_01120, partial [Bacteroidetes bacterium]|nr:hypothetical protein [Bacteroidota bacterium]
MFDMKGFRLGSLFFIALFFWLPLTGQDEKEVTIIGVGDMMPGTNYPSRSYLPPDGGAGLLRDVQSILQNADVTFGNLEGTLYDG